ncbi:thioesterase family protein [Nocardia sp. NPDC052001]|uniref:thioesterase family protein n=1 Tax=Nocardia sp. NPDC052001 TaxID=3154853 RepID=UPI0034135B39
MSQVSETTWTDAAETGDRVATPAYFVPVGPVEGGYERYLATESTVSVWAHTMQHGAPPSALLARAVERCAPREGMRVTRLTMEILGPIPVAEIDVRAWVERPGKRIELVAAELAALLPDGTRRVVAKASAWRIATTDTASVALTADAPLPPIPPSAQIGWDIPAGWDVGYVRTVDIRALPDSGGARHVWVRSHSAVVDGEPVTPLGTVFAVADLANGIGAQLDPAKYTFLNTDLTVDLFRLPVSEWIGLSVATSIGPDGVGMCSTVLHDEQGPIGRALQILEVRARD